MKKDINDLAYIINKARKDNKSKPIVLLGAGASVTGNIPLASGVVDKIIKEHGNRPSVQRLNIEEKKDYYKLMSALDPSERREIFRFFIKDSKINITNLYLAQLIDEGLVDYVLTVNFDDILQKACSLFNYTIPTYDVSNSTEFTTTAFQKKSVTYLHGQYYGEWLLNAEGELEKVKEIIPKLFQTICNNRPWIVVGYSGEDEIFDMVSKFSNFENGLYWVGFKNHKPSKKVMDNLINIRTKNSHLIEGYDADTFFLKLNGLLNLDTPKIMIEPFSFLKSMMNNVKNIEISIDTEEEHKDLLEPFQQNFQHAINTVEKAISSIEKVDSVENFQKEINDAIARGHFDSTFIEKINNSKFFPGKEHLSNYYMAWGLNIFENYISTKKKNLILDSLGKFEKAIELNNKSARLYYNYGFVLSKVGELSKDLELLNKSILMYEKSIEADPNYDVSYNNLANVLMILADKETKEEMKVLFQESIKLLKKAIELKPKSSKYYGNLGNVYCSLAEELKDLSLFRKAIKMFEKGVGYSENQDSNYYNWAICLFKMGGLLDVKYYQDALEKCKKAINLNRKLDEIHILYALILSKLAHVNNDKKLFKESLSHYEKANELNPTKIGVNKCWSACLILYSKQFMGDKAIEILLNAREKAKISFEMHNLSYNLACTYALMNKKQEALEYLKISLDEEEESINSVHEDDDWKDYLEDKDFIELLEKY